MSDFMDWLTGLGGQKFGGNQYGGNTFGGQTYGGNQYGASAPPAPAPEPVAAPEPAPVDPAPAGPSPYGNQKFGGNTFGGNTYGGNTYGGQTFGGNKFGASAPAAPDVTVPATPPPGANPLAGGAVGAGLPNIAGMLQDIKNAPPQPAPPPAAVAPPAPPQGDSLPPLPQQQVAANAPPAMAAPTPLTPAPDAGPAAPSDTPAGKSLLERILGSSDASTKDSSGLTEADRHATGFSALSKLGFGIMAASMPQNPNQRAQIISQLGSIPGSVLKERAAMIGQQAQAQRVQLGQQQLDQRNAAIAALKSPEFQAQIAQMPKSMQAIVRVAADSGDLATIAKLQQGLLPKMSGNMIFNPADGSYINTITGQSGGGTGGAPAGGGAAPSYQAPPGVDPNSPAEQYIARNVQSGDQPVVRAMANGDKKLPSLTDRQGIGRMVTQHAFAANPDLKEESYEDKKKMSQSVQPGGQLYKTTILPAQRVINHGAELPANIAKLDLFDGLGNEALNTAKIAKINLVGGKPKQDLVEAQQNLETVKEEFAKMLRGTGGITDQDQRRMDSVTLASGPSAIKGLTSWMQKAMTGQVDPVLQSYRKDMMNPRAGLETLLGQGSEANAAKIDEWTNGEKYAATRQQFGLKPDANVKDFEYSKDANGQIVRKRKTH